MNITEKNIKMWSAVGPRATYGLAIMELAKSEDKLVIITSDTSTSAGLDRFKKKYPDRYFDIGIAEQNTLGVSAGLANEGLTSFVSTFAPFQTMRCLEQIKVNLAYMQIPVNFVGLASGVNLGHLGYTHCCIEDIGVLRSLPNIIILSPCDSLEVAKSVFEAAKTNFPVYIRLTGDNKTKQIYQEDYQFDIGKCVNIMEGKKIAILATGSMVGEAKIVLEKFRSENIFFSLYNFHTIKPIDVVGLKKIAEQHELIITIEEHNIIGGLGSAVSEVLAKSKNNIKQVTLGIDDSYQISGDYRTILDKAGISAEKIYKRLSEEYEKL